MPERAGRRAGGGLPARLVAAYRSTGADLPWGDQRRAHGVAMEGYFWRLTDARRSRVVIALIGVNRGPHGPWATVGLAASNGFLRAAALPGARADPTGLGASSGESFVADGRSVRVDLGADARLDVTLDTPVLWPRRRPLGGSSVFQLVPGLNQYWHPWLLGGQVRGEARLGAETWQLDGCAVYGEKNWGKEGFPDRYWWGQAQGFREPAACVAFAGGEVVAGPFCTSVTAVVVRLPEGRLLRLGNPGTSPVRADISPGRWHLDGRSRGWRVVLDGADDPARAHVLPVPLPHLEKNVAGALEHLAGRLSVRVERRGRTVWAGESPLAGLEVGGLALQAQARDELLRRGAPADAAGAPPAQV